METFNCCVHSINKGDGYNMYLHTRVYNIEHGYNGSKNFKVCNLNKIKCRVFLKYRDINIKYSHLVPISTNSNSEFRSVFLL